MIRRNSKYLILSILLSFNLSTQAQRFFAGKMEFGVMFGGSNYHGDLAKEIVFSETHPMFGAYFQRNYNEWVSLRYQFSYAKISGSDKNFVAYTQRNLSFYSNIYEAGVVAEFNFNPFGLSPNMKSFSPYMLTGLSVFRFDPKTKYNNEVVSLRDLGTEGQGLDGKKKYSLIQPALPIGFGLKWKQSQNLVVGFELGFRKTWTDYLDDVKGEYPSYNKTLADKGQLAAMMSHRYKEGSDINFTAPDRMMRGDPHLNDWFFFINFRIGYKFGSVPCANDKSF
ncbi:MAG: DUF6089 family protein [Bacteroidetes bacterium]|nr:DUF6089 family protein [Bacteroidota bacterium]